MNREIKFRAKSMINGNWVYGHYAKSVNYPDSWSTHNIFIDGNYPINIDPSTLGQFTGLKDGEGNEIYEGDIIEVSDGRTLRGLWTVEVKFGYADFGNDAYSNCIGFYGVVCGGSNPEGLNSLLKYDSYRVVTNIYDNQKSISQS